jgi:FkbM family methyltransferase
MRPVALQTVVRAVVPRRVRNSLRSPAKLAEWCWDSAKFSLGATQTLQLLPDWSIRCHPEAYRVTYQAQVLDQEQREEFLGFVSHCSNQMFLFDIGAHFGIFSLAAAHFGGRALAIDPSPVAMRMVEMQAAINGLTSRIHPIRAAASESSGTLEMLGSGVFSHGYLRVVKGRSKYDLTQVNAITIDEMVQEFGVPTHIKVDVEGHEHAVLRGAGATLSNHLPILFLELHNELIRSEGLDPSAILDQLHQIGYCTFTAKGELASRDAILSRPIVRIISKPRTFSPTSIQKCSPKY